jgi:hypothetical protein
LQGRHGGGKRHRRELKRCDLAPRVPARGTPTMDEQALQAHPSMVGVPLAGTLLGTGTSFSALSSRLCGKVGADVNVQLIVQSAM